MSYLSKLIILLIFTFIYFNAAKQAAAISSCFTQYGGGETCQTSNIILKKQILNPKTNTFVDNLGPTDFQFSPGQIITFQISVQNTGNVTINQVNVTDSLPSELTLNSGSLNMNFINLAPNQTQNQQLSVQITNNSGNVCDFNNVTAKITQSGISTPSGATPAATSDQNTSQSTQTQFCVQTSPTPTGTLTPTPTGILTPTQGITATGTPSALPSTGPTDWPLFITVYSMFGAIGAIGIHETIGKERITKIHVKEFGKRKENGRQK